MTNKEICKMEVEKAYIVRTSEKNFRTKEPAEIIGVKLVKPNGSCDYRLCYEIEFSDGQRDFFAAKEGCKIVKLSDLLDEYVVENLKET